MFKEVEIAVKPSELSDNELIMKKVLRKARLDKPIKFWQIKRKSIDARGQSPLFRLRIIISTDLPIPNEGTSFNHKTIQQNTKTVIIIGAGPAGYFAALKCLELGIKPIVMDRGKDVRARRRDLKAIQQDGIVNPDSNYCFGEGGAGTYSDGKLYTRSHKRGNIKDILRVLVDHGANADILIDAHPHIGSNKLPKIIAQLRETILQAGGEIKFQCKVTDFICNDRSIKGVRIDTNEQHELEIFADAVVLATGHSARDIFTLCQQHGVDMEAKPFALGVRVEHPQALIDAIQYNQNPRVKELPASSYRVACQIKDTGVFSFCMCPGGLIVPASTSPQEIVVNGMSLSKRDSAFANSGVVVEVSIPYLESNGFSGVFAGVEFQQQYESAFFEASDGTQKAPAQSLTDFVSGKQSKQEMNTSYIPGLVSSRVDQLLPSQISNKLKLAMKEFDKKLKGYYTEEAHVIGLESRTSSPIRIKRDPKTLMSPSMVALFPCGEGGGFAGGILSAALDGRRVAESVAAFLG